MVKQVKNKDVFQEQTVELKYLIVDNTSSNCTLLVNCPDGVVLQFELPKKHIELLDKGLNDHFLWEVFFKSIIQSIDTWPQTQKLPT